MKPTIRHVNFFKMLLLLNTKPIQVSRRRELERQQHNKTEVNVSQSIVNDVNSVKASLFSTQEEAFIGGQLKAVLHYGKKYLKKRYSIRDLSNDTQIPIYKLSAYINQCEGINFNNYINRLRVGYCLELISSKNSEGLNLKGMAAECGFSNRNTFTIFFKKFTGYYPSEHAKMNKLKHAVAVTDAKKSI